MPSSPDAVITGSGVVTCLGASREATLAAIARGERVKGAFLPLFAGTPYENYLAAQGPETDISGNAAKKRMRKFMSRHSELAAAAAWQALEEANPLGRGIPAERIGLYAGVGLAAVDIQASTDLLRNSLDEQGCFNLERFSLEGLRTIHPLWSFHTLANMPACIVSVLEGIKGDNGIYTPWEDQTAFAMLEAVYALHRGDIDCAVVVAADTPAHPASLAELAASGCLAPREVASSGAGCIVLERPLDHSPTSFQTGLDTAPNVPLPRLRGMRLEALPAGEDAAAQPVYDPLSPFIGRTVAAAPLILAALAPALNLPCHLQGCGGHTFTFEVL